MTIVISIITMLLMFSVLALVHEFGHFIAARIFKIKVVEFSVFMGPRIWHHVSKKSGTDFSIRCLPLGGYCSFEDDLPENKKGEENSEENAEPVESVADKIEIPAELSDNPEQTKEKTHSTKLFEQVWWKRAIVFSAGVFMNIVLAIVISAVIIGISGFGSSQIASVDEDTPAALVGIEAGDTLINMNGISILGQTDQTVATIGVEDQNDDDLVMESAYTLKYKKADGKKVSYSVEKTINYVQDGEEITYKDYSYHIVKTEDGEQTDYVYYCELLATNDETQKATCNVKITIDGVENSEQKDLDYADFGILGNTDFATITTKNPFKMIGYGVKEAVSWVKEVYIALYWLVTGKLGMESMAGPIGMTSLVNDIYTTEAATAGVKVLTVVLMAGLISANLAVVNFLPFPGLDGFYVLLIIVEFIRGGKKISTKTQNKLSYLGLALLLILALVVAVFDVIKLF